MMLVCQSAVKSRAEILHNSRQKNMQCPKAISEEGFYSYSKPQQALSQNPNPTTSIIEIWQHVNGKPSLLNQVGPS